MSGGFKNLVIGYIFNYCGRTVRDMEKQMILLNSAHRIDLDIILNILLTLIGRSYSYSKLILTGVPHNFQGCAQRTRSG